MIKTRSKSKLKDPINIQKKIQEDKIKKYSK